ncbi:MAG: CHAT domain-containing protein [Bryobacterales bacterium]|nr:CHAT domain-containing protein [Bryobacterales bacterium]
MSRRVVRVLAAALPLCIALLPARAQPLAPLHRQGDVTEGLAASGQPIRIPIVLGARQFFFAQVNGIRVSLQLLDPQGAPLTEPARTVALLSDTSGPYTLRVQCSSPVPQRFRVSVLQWRDALPTDPLRLDAIRLLTEGYRQAELATAASRQQALARYTEARGAVHRVPDPWLEARTILGIANVHSAAGNTVEALAAYREAHALYLAAKDLPMQAFVRNAAALLHAARSEFPLAFDAYNQALAIRQAAGDRKGEAEVLRNLAIAHSSAGNFQTAIDTYQDVLARFRTLGDRYQEAVTLVQIGEFYLTLGDFDQAIRYARDALPLHTAHNDKTAQVHTMTNWGQALAGQGRHRDALLRYQAALDLSAASGLGWQHVGTQALAAESHEALGDLPKADTLYQEALGPMQAHGNYDGASRLLTRLGIVALRRGRLPDADTHLTAALLASEGLANPTARAMALTALARLAHQRKDRPAARTRVEQAIALVEEMRTRIDDRSLRATFLATRADWYDFYIALLLQQGDHAAAFAALERARARSLRELLLDRQPASAPLPHTALQSTLDPQTAVIAYHTGAYGAWVFVVTHNAIRAFPLPSSAILDAAVRDFRQLAATPGRASLGPYAQAAARLYRLCLQPAAAAIANRKHLVIIPDGPLHYLPFEALLHDTPRSLAFTSLPYLLRRWTISYAPSAAVWAALRAPAKDPSPPPSFDLVAFADPRGDLPGAAREVAQIATLFPPDRLRLFLGPQATRQSVTASPLAARSRRVHFAAHGRMPEGPAGAGGISLANGAVLNPLDILALRWRAELVVLSGCDTGLGPRLRGEGILGLTRAFLSAGAASVAVSLWPVHDESTAGIMAAFYRALQDGSPSRDALRQAKLHLIDSGLYAHPYYWAAFILAGRG